MRLTRFALRRPVSLVMTLASVLVLGLLSFGRLPLAFLPQVEFPFIGIVVPYPGGIPEQTEREIARPIEEIVATLGGLRGVESNSDEDQAFVGVEFDWGRDVNLLRLEVQEKVDQARAQLPSDVRDIFLFTFNSSEIPIVEGRISSKGRDLSDSWDLIETHIVQPLQSVPGVANVQIDGVSPTIGAIYLRLDKIKEFNVDVSRLFRELSAANINLTVGRITDHGLRYDVRAVSGVSGMQELGELPIDERGLRLSDVAELVYAAPAPSYGRRLNGEFAIAFWLQKASGYNTVEVARGVEAKLQEIRLDPALQGVDCFSFFNQAEQITNSLHGLWNAGITGSLLSMTVLWLFLRNIPLTLLISLSIPLSILGTGIWLSLTGRTLNVLTMMGLMLGIGMLVDNAVVVLESIHRRRSLGASPARAALRGTGDVGRAVIASTLTTVIVFAPIIVTAGNELAVWLGTVGLSISVTIVASLLVSLTVIPAFSVRFERTEAMDREAPWLAKLRARYLRMLTWTTLKRPRITGFVIVPGVLVLTIALAVITGFKPDVEGERGVRNERLRIEFHYTGAVDKRTSDAYVQRVEGYLEGRREELGLRDVYSFWGPDRAGMSLFFTQGDLSEEFLKKIREDLRKNLPKQAGVEYRFGDEKGNDSGAKRFAVTLFGEDTETLTPLVAEAKRRLDAVDGISDVASDLDEGAKEIQVAVDRDRAARHGVRAQDISQVLTLTYRGMNLPRLNTGTKEIDLQISLLPDDTESIENLSSLMVSSKDGQPVLLGQVADLNFVQSPRSIYRENGKTGVAIRGTWDGERMDEGLEKVEGVMKGMELPFGYSWNFGSEIRRAQEQNNEMGINLLLALFCVFVVMASLFESLVAPALVMACVPFSFLGVAWLMMATRTPFNIMAFIGMVILIGVIVNNGIVLVDHITHHRRSGKSLDDAIVAGCSERLRPILMTAGTTIVGLLPLAASGAHMVDAKYYPMARALIGGLLSGTFLTLVVLPTYYRMAHMWLADVQGAVAQKRIARRAQVATGDL